MANSNDTRTLLHRTRLAGAAAILAGLAACAGNNLPSISPLASNQAISEGYTVSAGDRLKVTVFDEENLTGEYQVGIEGDVQLPLIGSIDADSRSANGLAQSIAAKLKEGGYVLDPRVAVEIIDHRPIYILGEVNRPGEYEHHAGMTLEQAIAKAGGYSRRADTGRVVLKRVDWAGSRRIDLDGTALKIAPGDTITIKEAFF